MFACHRHREIMVIARIGSEVKRRNHKTNDALEVYGLTTDILITPFLMKMMTLIKSLTHQMNNYLPS
jgi:hypothetical protein